MTSCIWIRRLVPISLLVAVLAGCILPEEEQAPAVVLPASSVRSTTVTYPVERKRLTLEVGGTALATAVRQRQLYFTRSGRLSLLLVEPQQTVIANQILAALETDDPQHQLRLAQLDLEIATARLDAAQVGAPRHWTRASRGCRLPSSKPRSTTYETRLNPG